MYRYLIIGAGRMGAAIAADLARREDTAAVRACDDSPSALAAAEALAASVGVRPGVLETRAMPAKGLSGLSGWLAEADAAVSAVPYDHNPLLTDLAIAAGTHLVDLGGNPDIVRDQHRRHDRAVAAGVGIVPDCGLAPGMANVLAGHLAATVPGARSIAIRVGGLPQVPAGPLGYTLLFSPHGLINEYKEAPEALRAGRRVEVEPLGDLEELAWDGVGPLEAFNTAGGTGTMCETLAGALDALDYKTIRYPGHRDRVRMLFELGLFDEVEVAPGLTRRAVNEAALGRALDTGAPDTTLMRVDVRDGDGHLLERHDLLDRHDGTFTSMQRTTGFPAAITAWLLATGEIAARGVLRNEVDVPWPPMARQLRERGVEVAESRG